MVRHHHLFRNYVLLKVSICFFILRTKNSRTLDCLFNIRWLVFLSPIWMRHYSASLVQASFNVLNGNKRDMLGQKDPHLCDIPDN